MTETKLRRACRLAVATIVTLFALLLAPAASAQWETIQQPGGYGVARIEMAGPILGIGVTCERGMPVLAVRPQRSPPRSPAQLQLTAGDGRTVNIALVRNGQSDVWVAAIRNSSIIDALAASPIGVALGGQRAQVPSDGAAPAFRQALAGCYRPGPGAVAPAPTSSPSAASGTGLSAADLAAIQQAVRVNYDGTESQILSRTSPGYVAVNRRCSTLQLALDSRFGDGESFGMCGEDAGATCECQDMDSEALLATLKIAVEPAGPGAATATARFDLFRGATAEERSPRTILYRVVRSGTEWQVDDILTREGGALRSSDRARQMTAIREMEQRLGMPPWSPPADAAAPAGPPEAAPAVAAAASGTLTPADTAAAFRAAGFVQRGTDWRSDCDDPGTASYSPGAVNTVRDLNGDGSPDAILVEGGTYCYGNTGAGYFIVSKQPSGTWRAITSGTGIVTVLSSRGTGNWLDLEIGGPGFCFPVHRWNGREYALLRRQYDGKPCDS